MGYNIVRVPCQASPLVWVPPPVCSFPGKLTAEDEEALEKENLPKSVPILPLRNTVLFPGVVIPITASRNKSIQLIKDANNFNKLLGVVSQKDEKIEDPKANDIYNVCLLYTSPSPRDRTRSRMPSSA